MRAKARLIQFSKIIITKPYIEIFTLIDIIFAYCWAHSPCHKAMYAAVQKWPLVSATKTSRRARHICNRIVNGIGEVALERDGEAIQIRKVEIWRRTAHSDVKLLQVLGPNSSSNSAFAEVYAYLD